MAPQLLLDALLLRLTKVGHSLVMVLDSAEPADRITVFGLSAAITPGWGDGRSNLTESARSPLRQGAVPGQAVS